MNKTEIFALINQNPRCHLATTEGDQPHCRMLLLYSADEKGIVFHTGKMKDLHNQLSENKKVEFCFSDLEKGIQVRVLGVAKLDEDLELKKEIVSKRDFLKPMIENIGYENFAVYRIVDCKAQVWTMETNFALKEYIEL